MANAQDTNTIGLRLERTFDASPQRVFDAWTRAEALATWFAPSTDYAVVVTDLEPRVGGRYRIEMRHTGGNVHVVVGEYRELAAPSRLVMTWAWEGVEPAVVTIVTVELSPVGAGGTRVVVMHEGFPDDAARGEHQKGWTACFERLDVALGATQWV